MVRRNSYLLMLMLFVLPLTLLFIFGLRSSCSVSGKLEAAVAKMDADLEAEAEAIKQEERKEMNIPSVGPPPVRELTAHELVELDKKKRALRMANERYLRSKPELQSMIQEFVMHCLQTQPTDIEKEAVKYFVNGAGNVSQ